MLFHSANCQFPLLQMNHNNGFKIVSFPINIWPELVLHPFPKRKRVGKKKIKLARECEIYFPLEKDDFENQNQREDMIEHYGQHKETHLKLYTM